VLNGRTKCVSREKSELILQTARECGYPSGGGGRPLRTGNIRYVVPQSVLPTEPFYHRFLVGVEEVARQAGVHLLLYYCRSGVSPVKAAKNVDGCIIQNPIPPEHLWYLAETVPVVLLNWTSEGRSLDTVLPDNVGGIRAMVRHLFAGGHRRISFVQMGPTFHHAERFRGYVEGLRECGLSMREEFVYMLEAKEKTREENDRFARQFLERLARMREKPDAVVCSADAFAIPLVRFAPDFGLRIPADMSITGFDCTEQCHVVRPRLTSVNQPMEKMGRQAMLLLLERIKNPGLPGRRVVLETTLSILESTGPCHEQYIPKGGEEHEKQERIYAD